MEESHLNVMIAVSLPKKWQAFSYSLGAYKRPSAAAKFDLGFKANGWTK